MEAWSSNSSIPSVMITSVPKSIVVMGFHKTLFEDLRE